jgi:hypothetical protein
MPPIVRFDASDLMPADVGAGDLLERGHLGRQRRHRSGGLIERAVVVLLLVGLVAWATVEDKIRSTVITVVVAVAASAGLWIGANLLFNQARERWRIFNGIAWGSIGFILGVFLHGNQVTLGSGQGFFVWVVGPLLGFASFGALGYVLSGIDEPGRRRVVALAGASAIGVVIGLLIREEFHPGLDPLAMVAYTAALAAVGAAINALRKRPPVAGALTGAAIGSLYGFWGGADLGDGTIVTSVIATLVPAVLIGLRLGISRNPDYRGRIAIDNRSRAVIFVGPALAFVLVMLIIPAIRTLYLSLFGRDSEDFVGIENYTSIFTDRNSFDASNWTNMFTSMPFLLGVVLLAIAVVLGVVMHRRTGRAVELGNPTTGPLVVGGAARRLRRVHGPAGHHHQQPLVGGHGHVLSHGARTGRRGAGRQQGSRTGRQVDHLHADGDLARRRVDHLALHVRRSRHEPEQTGVMNAAVGRPRPPQARHRHRTVGRRPLIGLVLIGLHRLLVALGRSCAASTPKTVVPGCSVLLVGWLLLRLPGSARGRRVTVERRRHLSGARSCSSRRARTTTSG